MNDISLWLPALLLSLFCLIYSITARRELYFPTPKGLLAKLKDQHAVFLAVLGSLIIAVAISAEEALYGADFLAKGQLCALHKAGIFFCGLHLCLFLLYLSRLPKSERKLSLIPLSVIVVGILVQLIWTAPVALFFAAVSAFGCLVVFERDRLDSKENIARFRKGLLIAVAMTFLFAIVMNVVLIRGLTQAQSDEIGRIQLNIIRSELQDTLDSAKADLKHVAIRAEQLIGKNASREEIDHFINDQRESLLARESFMNIYIAGRDWHIVPGFNAPPDFHASERVWYIGAADHPGEVYITEPYKDANTGSMCFTVSTLLSDGKTVVAMDLNFSKVQESLREMTAGKDVSAMIVTEGGLIVGFTDMSLVGKSVLEKLPEFTEVFRRVTASRVHDIFRVRLDRRPCVIFSSETSNHWYLILSIGADLLYAESRRQIAAIASVNLLMLLVTLSFCLFSARNRLRAASVVENSKKNMDALSDKLRVLTARLQRLGDARLIKEGDEDYTGHVRDCGEQLSYLSEEVHSYSEELRASIEKEKNQGVKPRKDSSKAPSRSVLRGVIAVLVVAMVVVLFFCFRIAANLGDTRLNREVDRYENQLGKWITEQTSIIYMFTDAISAQPEIMNDYDKAVNWLNGIAKQYPYISACYLANPHAKIPVIMNTGWMPGENDRPETRPWYKATELAPNHFSISAPYFDVQTGNYCITFSRVVYGMNNEFLGIFGVDFFLDNLIRILGESYTSTGYAFLVDSKGNIINHPNDKYENASGKGVSIEDTEYAEAYHSRGITAIRDYSGRLVSCLTRGTESGFTVVVALRTWDIYGSVLLVLLFNVVLFGICIAFIVSLIRHLIRWQSGVNKQLMEAMTTAQNADKAKSKFLSNMSHEIRTPMNAIIGLDNIALKDQNLHPHTREQLEKIGASAKHLLGLINDILDMSRIESGRMTLKDEEFSFQEFLEQINVMVNGQCMDKGLHYDCVIVGNTEDCYVGDGMKLKQVLINILGNAVKFTEAPGSVTLTVEQTASFENHRSLCFVIRDTGIGMSKEFIPKIFEAFSQESEGASNKYGSTGLGMAITKNIVTLMNGDIHVDSEKGVGTTFTVTVTLKVPGQSANKDYSKAIPTGMRALIVDDEQISCEHARLVAEAVGIKADIAASGPQALDMFRASIAQGEPYQLILTDCKMPGMDGIAFTRELRGIDDGKTIVILLTGYSWEDKEDEARKAGVDTIMSKPLFTDNLTHSVQAILSQREKSSEIASNQDTDASATPARLEGCRILVAEDMDINAEILMAVLEMEGMQSERAENGQIAVNMFSEHPAGYYDAILMDVRMPVMDGLEATAAIRALKHPDAAQIPIIAMTANAFDEDVQRSLQAGMNAHLSKPVEPERLFKTLEQMIHSRHTGE